MDNIFSKWLGFADLVYQIYHQALYQINDSLQFAVKVYDEKVCLQEIHYGKIVKKK